MRPPKSLQGPTYSLHTERRLDALGCNGQIAEALAGCVGYRIGDCCRGRALSAFATAQERLPGPINHMHFDAVGNRVETKNGVSFPIDAGNAHIVETDV